MRIHTASDLHYRDAALSAPTHSVKTVNCGRSRPRHKNIYRSGLKIHQTFPLELQTTRQTVQQREGALPLFTAMYSIVAVDPSLPSPDLIFIDYKDISLTSFLIMASLFIALVSLTTIFYSSTIYSTALASRVFSSIPVRPRCSRVTDVTWEKETEQHSSTHRVREEM